MQTDHKTYNFIPSLGTGHLPPPQWRAPITLLMTITMPRTMYLYTDDEGNAQTFINLITKLEGLEMNGGQTYL